MTTTNDPLAGFTVGVTAARRADELCSVLQRRRARVHASSSELVQTTIKRGYRLHLEPVEDALRCAVPEA